MHRGPLTLLLLVGLAVTTWACSPEPVHHPAPVILVRVPAKTGVEDWELRELPRYPSGTQVVFLDRVTFRETVLSEGLDRAAWPQVSPSGAKVVFSMKREPLDPWTPVVMDLATRDWSVLPHGPGDCVQPAWVDDSTVVMRCRAPDWAPHLPDVGALYLSHTDAEGAERITFDRRPVHSPLTLPDGRILYTRTRMAWDPTSEEVRTTIMWVHRDGTVATPLQVPSGESAAMLKLTPRLLQDHGLSFVGTMGWRSPGTVLDEPRPPVGRLFRLSLAIPSAPAEPLRPDLPGSVLAASASPGGELLVCLRPSRGKEYKAYHTGVTIGDRIRPLYGPAGWHVVDVVPVAPRTRPAGRLSLVSRGKPAWLYLLDPYLGDDSTSPRATRGSIRRVRLYTSKPVPPPSRPIERGDLDPDRFLTERPEVDTSEVRMELEVGGHTPGFERVVLGEVEVHEDGSFLVQVPADTPLTLELLSAAGEHIANAGGWFWVRPNEKRGCVGCHEPPDRAPDERFYEALVNPPSRLIPPRGGTLPEMPTPQKGEPEP